MTYYRDRIGVMGGTFDPIHNGHLFCASEAMDVLSLDYVLFIPSGTPPHKTRQDMASSEDRYEMVYLAIEEDDRFKISDIEIKRQGRSYTVDTLRELHDIYDPCELFFITGYDALLDMPHWREPLKIAEMANIVAICREGYERDKASELPKAIQNSMILVEAPKLEISSTEVRNRVSSRRSIHYLVPEKVIRYITERDLYHMYK